MTKEEFTGRLMLWDMAVGEAQQLLKTAKRALAGLKQKVQKDEQGEYELRLSKFIQDRDDYKEDHITTTQCSEFSKVYNRPFPYLAECILIHHACLNLAIIHFCQIFTTGHGNSGATSNKKEFQDAHLKPILQKVFITDEQMEKFNELREKIKQVRDGMIGHADAELLNIQHKEVVTTIGGSQIITQELDLDFWLSFMEPLHRAILEYMNENKKDYA